MARFYSTLGSKKYKEAQRKRNMQMSRAAERMAYLPSPIHWPIEWLDMESFCKRFPDMKGGKVKCKTNRSDSEFVVGDYIKVFCRDCREYKKSLLTTVGDCRCDHPRMAGVRNDPDFFCKHGVRKEEPATEITRKEVVLEKKPTTCSNHSHVAFNGLCSVCGVEWIKEPEPEIAREEKIDAIIDHIGREKSLTIGYKFSRGKTGKVFLIPC